MPEYGSVGGAFTNSLLSAGLQREALKRQAMLDAIKVREAADTHDEAMQALEEKRTAAKQKVSDKKESQTLRRVAGLAVGDIPEYGLIEDAKAIGIPLRLVSSPGVGSALPAVEMPAPPQTGRIPEAPVESTPMPTGRTALPTAEPMPARFAGIPSQALVEKQNQAQLDYINSLPEGPAKTAATYELRTGKPIPAGALKTDADKHSPAYIEYQDYKKETETAGQKPLDFNSWATMDANRKNVNKPNAPQPQIFYDANGKPHAMQFTGGEPKEIPLPANLTGKTSPISAAVWTRVNAAKKVGSHIGDVESEIEEADRRGLLGPLKGRMSEFLAGKIGSTGDPDNDFLLGKLRLDISAVKSGFGMVHSGSRAAIGLLKRWDEVLNAKDMSKETLLGSLDGMQGWLSSYAEDPTKPEGETTPSSTAKPVASTKRKTAAELYSEFLEKK